MPQAFFKTAAKLEAERVYFFGNDFSLHNQKPRSVLYLERFWKCEDCEHRF